MLFDFLNYWLSQFPSANFNICFSQSHHCYPSWPSSKLWLCVEVDTRNVPTISSIYEFSIHQFLWLQLHQSQLIIYLSTPTYTLDFINLNSGHLLYPNLRVDSPVMGQLSTDAIVTLASAIPGLLIASLSAWLSYTTLRRGYISRNDVETLTIEFIVAHTSTNPRYASRCKLCSLYLNYIDSRYRLRLHTRQSTSHRKTNAFPNCNSPL